MVRCGAVGALMSGAGPTVFGLVPDQETGMRLKDKLGYLGHRAFLVRSAG
jgi:4-diphosphocytidyl-2-C-methyl-D-erythritol kinase